MNRDLIAAQQEFDAYTNRERKRTDLIPATLGDGHGHVLIGTSGLYVWARLYGDSRRRVRVRDVESTSQIDNTPIEVSRVPGPGKVVYRYAGRNGDRAYASDPQGSTVGVHASQHLRADRGQGGFDPVDIYTRALINLRARAQATPDLTIYVERGFYFLGTLQEWLGGSSPAFTPPTDGGSQRWDLLYLGNDAALHITSGTETSLFVVPSYPAAPDDCIPVAYVLLVTALTAITEAYITDARVLWTATEGAGGGTDADRIWFGA